MFTSYGTIYWLDDLKKWANIINECLKSKGIFYFIDGHPFADMINEKITDNIQVGYNYFTSGEPYMWEEDGDYTDEDWDNPTVLENKLEYGWNHTISEFFNSLKEVGLKIEFLHEFPYTFHRYHEDLKKNDDGYWRFQKIKFKVPMMLSIKARKH